MMCSALKQLRIYMIDRRNSGSTSHWGAVVLFSKIISTFLVSASYFVGCHLRYVEGQALNNISEILNMKKLVRVIKLQPGEAVLIVVEDNSAPSPCCGACMLREESDVDIPFPSGILVCLDDAA